MGDLIMTGPALRALKKTFQCRITILSSSAAAGIAGFMPEIDEVMVFDVPWVKSDISHNSEEFTAVIDRIKQKRFDGAVIFTVYSQNPLPTVMLTYLANIPLRLAYCRENPYQLLTDWVPDKEPYLTIKHQVQRDLDLVAFTGAETADDRLTLNVTEDVTPNIFLKLSEAGVDLNERWILIHAGVSESKRSFPAGRLVETAKSLIAEYKCQVLFTGSTHEKELTDHLQHNTGDGSFSIAGLFDLKKFINLVAKTELLISVNSGPVHIAAAFGTPVLVLYAQTNPQHTPWKSPNRVLYYSIDEEAKSKNEVIAFVNNKLYADTVAVPTSQEIINAAKELIDFN